MQSTDIFMEYMIKQKKKGSAIIKSIFTVVGAIFLSLIISFIFLWLPPFVISIWPMCVAAIMFGAYKIIASFDVEFEYILTNGELDVDKITHKKKRKRLITIHCKSFTHFGKTSSDSYKNLKTENYAQIIDASANSENFEDYYAVFFKNGQRIMLIFNPTQKMIDAFKVFAPRVVM